MREHSRRSMESGFAAGFTLLEMLVALTIVALMATAVPRLMLGNSGSALRAVVQHLAEDLIRLHDDARRRDAIAALVILRDGYALEPADERRALPVGTSILFTPAASFLLNPDTDQLRFFPDGSATGGTLIVRQGSLVMTLPVDWRDGMIGSHD